MIKVPAKECGEYTTRRRRDMMVRCVEAGEFLYVEALKDLSAGCLTRTTPSPPPPPSNSFSDDGKYKYFILEFKMEFCSIIKKL